MKRLLKMSNMKKTCVFNYVGLAHNLKYALDAWIRGMKGEL